MFRISSIISAYRKERERRAIQQKAWDDLEADRQRRMSFDRLDREDRRAARRIEKGMRVHG